MIAIVLIVMSIGWRIVLVFVLKEAFVNRKRLVLTEGCIQ